MLDKSGAIVAQSRRQPRPSARTSVSEDKWKDGITNSPHGASIDKDGNLIVTEWSAFGHLHKFLLSK